MARGGTRRPPLNKLAPNELPGRCVRETILTATRPRLSFDETYAVVAMTASVPYDPNSATGLMVLGNDGGITVFVHFSFRLRNVSL